MSARESCPGSSVSGTNAVAREDPDQTVAQTLKGDMSFLWIGSVLPSQSVRRSFLESVDELRNLVLLEPIEEWVLFAGCHEDPMVKDLLARQRGRKAVKGRA